MLADVMNNQYDDLLSAIIDLERQGYKDTLLFVKGFLYNAASGEKYDADEISITEFHRFEGDTNYDDMAILYAIDTPDGSKGLVIDAYGTYADQDLGEFMKRAKIL